MTKYNGQTITYDAIGNPLSYRDGISLTWQNGRELASFTNADTSVSYTYDASGMRTSKTITDGTTTDTVEYVYEGGQLLQMRYNHMYFDFIYDANGNPVSMAYRSTAASSPMYYYYGLNSRGDVVALYYNTGALYAKYTYDVYGKLLSITNSSGSPINTKYSPAKLNPLRYRGYVYDNETGFYYLQTRYYDPTTCRFVNGDDTSYLGVNGFNSYNLYAYCNNNPIMHIDSLGTWAVAIYPIGGSASFFGGVTYNLGIAFDGEGNFDVIVSYADPLLDSSTWYFGSIGVGGTFTLQYLGVDNINGIYGYSRSMGGSGGPYWFVGGDLYFEDINDDKITAGQIVGGIGAGLPFDVRFSDSKTVSAKDFVNEVSNKISSVFNKPKQTTPSNQSNVSAYYQKLTVMERRLGAM